MVSIIFISTIIITGKAIKGVLLFIVNFFKKIYFDLKEKKRVKEEKLKIEKQEKLEKEIYEEICNIQKIYQEKEKNEKDDDNDDTSIEISEEKRDTEATWLPSENPS